MLCGFANTGPGSLCLALCLTFGAKGSKLELPTTYIDCHSLPLIELSWTNQLSYLRLYLVGGCHYISAYHGHDDQYLLISVEVSLKTASRIVHTSIDHDRDEQRPIKENIKKNGWHLFYWTWFLQIKLSLSVCFRF